MYYKLLQVLLQSYAALLCYKAGQVVLQSMAGITKWGNFYYNVRQVLQSGQILQSSVSIRACTTRVIERNRGEQ